MLKQELPEEMPSEDKNNQNSEDTSISKESLAAVLAASALLASCGGGGGAGGEVASATNPSAVTPLGSLPGATPNQATASSIPPTQSQAASFLMQASLGIPLNG